MNECDVSYQPQRQARSTMLPINRLRYHVREWGERGQPSLFMLHGWMDVSASFQFLVDCLSADWHVVAPDWRGYGLTEWSHSASYWMADYLADLDRLLDHYSPHAPVRIVGHSMGGNIAGLYAGVRKERVRAFINLEGLGLPGDTPDKLPGRMAKWLDQLKDPPSLRDYASFDDVAQRLQKTNPRLTDARARFLSHHWSAKNESGRYSLRADPAHKIINPAVYRADEIVACWEQITAPVLWVMARDSDYAKKMDAVPDYADRLARIAVLERLWVDDAAHMLHHDQPELLAQAIEQFLVKHGHGPQN